MRGSISESEKEEKVGEDSGYVGNESSGKEAKPSDYQQSIPFPEALKSLRPLVQSNKLIEALKETTINIPLEEAIRYIPSVSKYVKELCTPHRKPTRIKLSESVSSIILNEIPQKKKDPGAPLITFDIGGMKFSRSLLDSGAGVNLLLKALYDKFKFGELEPIFLELQLADGSIKKPLGILEDVMVRVEQCVFPVDFIIAEMSVPDHLSRAPIILGRPFLATTRAMTDWEKGLVVLRVREESVELNISKLMKYPSFSHEDVGTMDLVEDDFDYRENFLEICGVHQLEKLEEPIDPLFSSDIELKTLPSSLKYAFLGPTKTLLAIISSSLTPSQEESLMCVLREHRAAIGWSFDDIKGVPSSLCEHIIFIEEGAKPSRESQRRINPHMLEVIKNEILKGLKGDVIYAISDSSWVSPVHMVPKKTGITREKNEKGEEVQTRLATSWRVCIDYGKLNLVTKKKTSIPYYLLIKY